MPTAIDMQRKYGDRLNTLLVEVQSRNVDEVRTMALSRKWFGTDAMWTIERPVVTGARGIPNCVLLSPDGEVVLMGHPMTLHGDIEDYIEAATRGRLQPPETLPKELQPAWRSLQKGDYAAALAAADEAAHSDDGSVVQAARELAAESRARAEREVERCARAIDSGVYASTRSRLERLRKACEGLPCAVTADELLVRLDSDALAAEVAAEKMLAKVEHALFDESHGERMKPALEKVLTKHAGTKAAARAQDWLRLVSAGD